MQQVSSGNEHFKDLVKPGSELFDVRNNMLKRLKNDSHDSRGWTRAQNAGGPADRRGEKDVVDSEFSLRRNSETGSAYCQDPFSIGSFDRHAHLGSA